MPRVRPSTDLPSFTGEGGDGDSSQGGVREGARRKVRKLLSAVTAAY